MSGQRTSNASAKERDTSAPTSVIIRYILYYELQVIHFILLDELIV